MESPETGSSEQNTNEQIASKMHDILDRVKQPQNHEALGKAGYEFANERYDSGQGILEKNGFWHDTIREVAVEANQAERDKKGNTPLSFTEAKNTINGYAKSLAESGTREDKKSALAIENIVLGTDRPGIEGIDEALKYIEGVLQTKARSGSKMTPEMKKQRDEQRAARDALFLEKQKRIEPSSEKPDTTTQSGVYNFSKEEVTKMNKRDKVELGRVREKLGLNEETPEKIPTDRRNLMRYFKDHFGKMEGVPLEEFRKEFTSEIESNFRAWVSQHLKTLVEEKPSNGRYPDTVASVLSNNEPFLQRIVSLEEGRVIDMDKLLAMPFSEVAKKYLNIDLPKDYFDNFSRR